jgi:hypothetical protein
VALYLQELKRDKRSDMSTNEGLNPSLFTEATPLSVILDARRFGEMHHADARPALLAEHSGRAALLLVQTVIDSSPATTGAIRAKFAEVLPEDTEQASQNAVRNWAEAYVETGVFSVKQEKNKRLYQGTALARNLLPLVGFFHNYDARHRTQGLSIQNIFGRPNGPPATDDSQLRRVWALRHIASRLQTGDDLVVADLAKVLKTESRQDYASEVVKRLARVGLFELNDWSVTEETIYETVHKGQRPELIAGAGDVLRRVVDYSYDEIEVSREELHDELFRTVPAYAELAPPKQRMALANVLARLETRGMLHKVHGRFTDGRLEIDATKDQRAALSDLFKGLDEFAGGNKKFMDTWGAYAVSLADSPTELAQMATGFLPAPNRQNPHALAVDKVLEVIREEGAYGPIGSAEITRIIAEDARKAGTRIYDRQTIDTAVRRLLKEGKIASTTVNQGSGFTPIQ